MVLLNALNYSVNSKLTINDFLQTHNKIIKSKVPSLDVDANYLMSLGMKEGKSLGKVLKLVEEEWLENSFKISRERVKKLVETFQN